MRYRPSRAMAIAIPLVLAAFAGAAYGQSVEQSDQPLTTDQVAGMSLEELMALNVTSVAGVEKEWFSTPAAIAVITNEDVRRSGARTLADALRMAPGVFVGRANSRDYSVGMRGFNGSLANKTLVRIDGRAVYDPLLGGTFWDVQDIFLDDLDQIEVIRGPGATLWGANAVNGVINVTTKSAKDTQGFRMNAGLGTYEKAFGEARYGLQLGESSWLRFYGKWFERDHQVIHGSSAVPDGESGHDDWEMLRGGFRFDYEGHDDLTLTLQGDIYNSDRVGEFTPWAPVPGQSTQFVNDIRDQRRAGGNLLLRLAREQGESGWSLQTYYDRAERNTNVTFRSQRDTIDFDWRHHFKLGERHEVVWGLGARHSRDQTVNGSNFLFDPQDGSFTTVSGFIQDTITLVADRWFAMVGSKFSHNTYTGFEVQPSARLWWTPNEHHTVWASVSRPVRVPSRSEEQGMIALGYIDAGVLAGGAPTGVIIPLGIQANDDLKSERLMAYEMGYRWRANEKLSIDTAIFFNDYDRLIYVPSLISPWSNEGYGETWGGEIALRWQVADDLRVDASYSYVDVNIHGPVEPFDEASTPHNQAQARVLYDLTDKVKVNAVLAYVDNVAQVNASNYWRLDLGVSWQVTPHFELSVWGQNLLEPRHHEFSPYETARGVYVMGTVQF